MIVSGDARRLPLPDESVQCIVTSPPYWGLRKYAGEQELVWRNPQFLSALDCEHEYAGEGGEAPEIRTGLGLAKLSERYRGGGKKQGQLCEHEWTEETTDKSKPGTKSSGLTNAGASQNEANRFVAHHGTCTRCGAWRGAYGLEPTVEMYVEHTLVVLQELRRVLRKDGVLFWNLGDSYCANASSLRAPSSFRGVGGWSNPSNTIERHGTPPGLKPKDLVLMPFRVALAAQADGWWVRSVIVWAKPNPMPESVTDRPTDAYEHILMLTRSARYFWDADAVREPAGENTHSRGDGDGGPKARDRADEGVHEGWTESTREILTSRNMRNVWEFATQPYSGAHFATFPEELPRRCILAATSAKGACRFCRSPWERIAETTVENQSGSGRAGSTPIGKMAGGTQVRDDHDVRLGPCIESRTIGWSPTCLCRGQHARTVPCVVLDPFAGSGTTGRVAIQLNRRPLLLDLAYARATAADLEKDRDYAELARERTTEVQRALPLC